MVRFRYDARELSATFPFLHLLDCLAVSFSLVLFFIFITVRIIPRLLVFYVSYLMPVSLGSSHSLFSIFCRWKFCGCCMCLSHLWSPYALFPLHTTHNLITLHLNPYDSSAPLTHPLRKGALPDHHMCDLAARFPFSGCWSGRFNFQKCIRAGRCFSFIFNLPDSCTSLGIPLG